MNNSIKNQRNMLRSEKRSASDVTKKPKRSKSNFLIMNKKIDVEKIINAKIDLDPRIIQKEIDLFNNEKDYFIIRVIIN